MRKRLIHLTIGLALGVLFLVGSGSPVQAQGSCKAQSDCPPGTFCSRGPIRVCIRNGSCINDGDCTADFICKNSACVADPRKGGIVAVCRANADCPAQHICEKPTPAATEGLCVFTGIGNPGPFNPDQGLPKDILDFVNPLKQFGDPAIAAQLETPGGIISRVLLFAFPAAGMILFIMIFWGGAEMTFGSVTRKSIEAGRQRITGAFIGFIVLFCSYWIIQIIEVIFGVKVL